ncbi:MAG: hypothetical protein ACE5FZ_00300, partial [Nitrospiria bacterium]
MAFGPNNTPYVVWTEDATINPGVNPVEVSHIFVKHFNGTSWVQDGASLNVNPDFDGFNPTIAINGSTINVAWTECSSLGNCELYIKEWLVGGTPPLAPTTTLTSIPDISDPDDASLVYHAGVLYASWHETGKLHVRRDPNGTLTNIDNMGFVVNGSNNTLLFNDGAVQTATIAQQTYTTGSALAAALKSALESANTALADTYTVNFDPATGIFSIMNDASNTNALTLLFGNVGSTAGEILGFNPVDSAVIAAGGSTTSDFDARPLIVPPASNTPLAGTGSAQGPYLAFVKVPNTTSISPELLVRLWDDTTSTWRSVVDGKLNMTTANPSPPINASVAVSSSGSVFVAWVEAGPCLDEDNPNSCGTSNSSPFATHIYVKQLQ